MSISKAPRFSHGGLYDATATQQYTETAPDVKILRLADDEIEKSVNRLAQGKKYKIDDTPLLPPIKKGKGEIEQQVDRLYTQSVKMNELKMERLQRAEYRPAAKKLNVDEMDDAVARLYGHSKEAVVSRVKQRYMADPKYKPHEPKKMASKKIAASTTRMYQDSIKQRELREKKLYEKYILATEPTKRRLPADTIAASSDRLYRNEAAQ